MPRVHDQTRAQLGAGADVIVRGERWTVLSTSPHPDCTSVHLAGAGRGNAGTRCTYLFPFDRPSAAERSGAVAVVGRRRWWRTVARQLAGQRPLAGLDALASAAIDLLPYQLEPALALLRHGRSRVLIADEVGLGKTIQSAAVLAQLASDEPDLRALIVCPAGLRGQWRNELASRLGLHATTADVTWVVDAARELPPTVNPWALPGILITSIDLVKRTEVLRALEDVTWDICILDEAHGLSPGTARLAAAQTLATRSRRLLLLTATPPDGEPGHIDALLSLGRGAGGAEITVFRRTRADTGAVLRRRTSMQPVRLSAAELRMHRLLDDYSGLLWREATRREDGRIRLVTILLRKRALSSARSLAISLVRRLALLGTHPAAASQLRLPLHDEDPLDDIAADAVIAVPGLDDVTRERQVLNGILQAAEHAARAESKIRVLTRFLARASEPAIVFTEYRDTLGQLRESLAAYHPMELHGEMLPHEREHVQALFAASGGLLLATDAAAEGLNLHQGCRLVVHFELPWNPMRLEQRAGRVDRLGQSRRVHEVLLVARHTAERMVLAPLVRRLRAADHARGLAAPGPLTESDVAALILAGEDTSASAPAAVVPTETLSLGPEAAEEVRRLTELRRISVSASKRFALPLVVAGDSSSGSMIVIVRIAGRTAAGRELATMLLPVRVEPSLSTRSSAASLARLVCGPWWEQIAGEVRHHVVVHPNPWVRWNAVVEALVRREREMSTAMQAPEEPLVQPGLFDRRAAAGAEVRRKTRTVLRDDADARARRLRLESDVGVRVTPVAILFGELEPR